MNAIHTLYFYRSDTVQPDLVLVSSEERPDRYLSTGSGSPEPQEETLRPAFFLSEAKVCANGDSSRILGPFQ